MPATDPTLNMITANNRSFGTIRFDEQAAQTDYNQGLNFAAGQLPSSYFADSAVGSSYSCRLRPLHEAGFVVTQRSTRLYLAVAGLPSTTLKSDLRNNTEQVSGVVYKSKYYVFVKLGVMHGTINNTLTALVNGAQTISTAQLQNANLNKNVRGPTRVVYINQGALQGTFWAHKHAGWGTGFGRGSYDGMYRPLQLKDFRIAANHVAQAEAVGNGYRASLNLIPDDYRRIHSGHALMDVAALGNFYTNAVPTVNGITGATIWNNLMRLSARDQIFDTGQTVNGVNVAPYPIMSGEEYFSLREMHGSEHQKQTIYNMINAFL